MKIVLFYLFLLFIYIYRDEKRQNSRVKFAELENVALLMFTKCLV